MRESSSVKVYAYLTGIFATVSGALMLGAIRWGVPAYAQEISQEVVAESLTNHAKEGIHEKHAQAEAEQAARLVAVERGMVILLKRSGGAPTDAEMRDTEDWMEKLRR